MTPNAMPRKLGATPPKPRRHHDECRCLDCIDWEGNIIRAQQKRITQEASYRAARRAVGL